MVGSEELRLSIASGRTIKIAGRCGADAPTCDSPIAHGCQVEPRPEQCAGKHVPEVEKAERKQLQMASACQHPWVEDSTWRNL